MASILDAGLVTLFSGIFVFLLIFAIVYGALSRLKMFGDKMNGIYAIISLCIGMLMAIAPTARNFVLFIAPWYLALAVVIFFILFIVGMFGLSADKDFPKIINDSKVKVWFTMIVIIIMIAGFAFTFGQGALETQTGPTTGGTNNGNTAGGTNVIGGDGSGYQEPGTIIATPPPGYPTTGGYAPGGVQAGQPGSTATGDFQTNLVNTLIHPKVLGMIVTIFIAAVAIYFLSGNP
jgi:hypothetical protein